MSFEQDRLTFIGVLIAVVVVVLGYLQLGQFYPTAGRASEGSPEEIDTGDRIEVKPDAEAMKEDGPGGSALREEDAVP